MSERVAQKTGMLFLENELEGKKVPNDFDGELLSESRLIPRLEQKSGKVSQQFYV